MAETKWFLKDTIVDTGMCTLCGACAAVCPYDLIRFDENGPYIKDECYRNGEGACKDVCQRVMTDASRISLNTFNFKAKPPSMVGQYEKIVSARATDEAFTERGQDGGAVSSLIAYCMDKEIIDGAITTAGFAKPAANIIGKREDITISQGAKYSTVPLLSTLRNEKNNFNKVAVVGTPCQTYGVRRMQYFNGLNVHPVEKGMDGEFANNPTIEYTIGLFCMENFNYHKLSDFLEKQGIKLNDIKRYSIQLDEMIITTDEKNIEIPLKDLQDCVWDGCKICRDAVSKVADISAGSTGSSKGWTTLIARNAKGLKLLNDANEAGYIEISNEVDIEMIKELAQFKMNKFRHELDRRLNSEEKVSYYWVRDYPGIRPEVNGTNFVKIKTDSGITTHEYLGKVAELAKKYGDGTLEMTARKSIEIQGVPGRNIDDLMAEIYDAGLKTIGMGYATACPGMDYCPEGLMSTKELANKLTMHFAQKLTPHKMKVGVAGCPNSCVRVRDHDIGIMGQLWPVIDETKCTGCGRCTELCKFNAISIDGGKAVINRDLCGNCGWCVRGCPHEAALEDKRGYSLWIGGNGARRPTEGVLIKSFCDEEEIIETINDVARAFIKYRTNPGKERLGNIMDKIGQGTFIKEILEN
jgi:coenzyme F420 hydrogenase subunit beta